MRISPKALISPGFQHFCFRAGIFFYLLILAVGSIPGARQDIANYATGLVLHSVAYAVISTLIFVGTFGAASRRAFTAILTVAAMGALDEYVQSFFPYRTAAITDWLVDTVSGLVVSVVLWRLWPQFVRRIEGCDINPTSE
jgi:VanZ family protein